MTAFDDPLLNALREREGRRSRTLQALRGWLRSEHHPRTSFALMLLVCAAFAASVSLAMESAGFELRGLRWAFAVGASWPLFLALLRWRTKVAFRRFDLAADMRRFGLLDEAAEAALASTECRISDECREAIAREAGHAAGNNGLPAIALLIVISAGTWLVWDLIQSGPRMFAETMLDRWLVSAHPALSRDVHTEPWLANAAGGTGLYFLAFSLCVLLAGICFPPFVALPF